MKLVVVCLIVVSVAYGSPDEKPKQPPKYTTKYDNVNVDEILKSDRLLKNYVNCLVDKGKCTPDAEELKRVLPDALHNDCSKCSEKQKVNSDKIVSFLIEKKKDLWTELEAKYDKKGEYKKKYDAKLKQLSPKA